uniref:U4/U6.U5 small nuclear ribonucleoprotein 27kDa protein domain-containing protein n=1 Tax=Arion vulgaris TaxID=1028688 RepID=A0A0B7BJ36_9EUPU
MQNQFYQTSQRFTQGQNSFENSDQGTWQIPLQGQEDTYYTGSSTNYYTSQQSAGGGSSMGSGHAVSLSADGMSPVFSTGITSYNKNNVGNNTKGMQNSGVSNPSQYSLDSPQQTGTNSHFMSNQANMQDRSIGKIPQGSQDDCGTTGYYDHYDGFSNESYMTNSGGNMMEMNSVNSGFSSGDNSINMGGFEGSLSNLGGFEGSSSNMGSFGGSSANIGSSSRSTGGTSVNMGSTSFNVGNNENALNIGHNDSGMGHSGNFSANMMGNYGSENTTMGMSSRGNNIGMSNGTNNTRMDVSGNFGNTQLQNQLVAAAVGIGALANWHENCGNNSGFNNVSVNFANNKRGKRGRGFGTVMTGGQNHPAAGNNLAINLNATNHNQWCFLRKNFSKKDNDFAEHLFDIHEKFCHHCRERIEEKKYGKKKKYSDEPTAEELPAVEKEVPDEELTEDELAIKKLMGFAGFKTTKGYRVKDNNYSTVSSVNTTGSSDTLDETTTLTEAEKAMIAKRGGFSVFTKPNISGSSGRPGFGAPAVTFDSEDNEQGLSNEPLFNKISNSHLKKDNPNKSKK